MKRISEAVKTYESLGYECGMWITTLGYGRRENVTSGSYYYSAKG